MANKVGPTPQPQMGQPTPPTAAIPGAPQPVSADSVPGVEHFAQIPQLWVKQKLDWLELFSGFEVSNTYKVYLTESDFENGREWLLAKENSTCFQRQCLGPCREFDLEIGVPRSGNASTLEQQLGLVTSKFVIPTIKLHRDCFWCVSSINVTDGHGNTLGSIEDQCLNHLSLCPVRQKFLDGQGQEIMKSKGPPQFIIQWCHRCPCRGPFTWEITDSNTEEQLGSVLNLNPGCMKQCFGTADTYQIDFKEKATPQQRALMLAEVFMLDYAYFEVKQKKNQNNGVGIALSL